MNRIYKLIWSKTRNCYVVVSELAKSHTKGCSGKRVGRLLAVGAVVAGLMLPMGSVEAISTSYVPSYNSQYGSSGPADYQTDGGHVDVGQIGGYNQQAGSYYNYVYVNDDGTINFYKNENYQQNDISSMVGNVAIGNFSQAGTGADAKMVNFYNSNFQLAYETKPEGATGTWYQTSAPDGKLYWYQNSWNNRTYAYSPTSNYGGTFLEKDGKYYHGVWSPDLDDQGNYQYDEQGNTIGSYKYAEIGEKIWKQNPDNPSGNLLVDYKKVDEYGQPVFDLKAEDIGLDESNPYGYSGGTNNVAVGNKSKTLSHSSVAVGDTSTARGYRSVAIGAQAEAGQENAGGDWNNGTSAVAIGDSAKAYGGTSVAVGSHAQTYSFSGVAVGNNANASTEYAIAIGDNARVAYVNGADDDETKKIAVHGIAIGRDTLVEGKDGTAVGRQSQALMRNATAYGNNAHADAFNSVAIGNKAIAGSQKDTSLGQSAVAVGNRATALDEYTTAIGASTFAKGTHSVTVGDSNRATGAYSTAIGAGWSTYTVDEDDNDNTEKEREYDSIGANQATGDYSTSVGYGNATLGQNSTAVGMQNAVSGKDSLAYGSQNKVGTDRDPGKTTLQDDAATVGDVTGYAIGSYNEITGNKSLAVGTENKVSGEQSIAIGTGHTVSGNNSGAIGDPSYIKDDNAYAIGNNNTIEEGSANTFIVGNNVKTTAENTVVFGHHTENNAHTFGQNSVSLGTDAQATIGDSVALGSTSVAKRAAANGNAGAGYDVRTGTNYAEEDAKSPTWVSTLGAVSVGGTENDTDAAIGSAATATRQITGVAAGTADTDAVNVAQLKLAVGGVAGANYELVTSKTDNEVNKDSIVNTYHVELREEGGKEPVGKTLDIVDSDTKYTVQKGETTKQGDTTYNLVDSSGTTVGTFVNTHTTVKGDKYITVELTNEENISETVSPEYTVSLNLEDIKKEVNTDTTYTADQSVKASENPGEGSTTFNIYKNGDKEDVAGSMTIQAGNNVTITEEKDGDKSIAVVNAQDTTYQFTTVDGDTNTNVVSTTTVMSSTDGKDYKPTGETFKDTDTKITNITVNAGDKDDKGNTPYTITLNDNGDNKAGASNLTATFNVPDTTYTANQSVEAGTDWKDGKGGSTTFTITDSSGNDLKPMTIKAGDNVKITKGANGEAVIQGNGLTGETFKVEYDDEGIGSVTIKDEAGKTATITNIRSLGGEGIADSINYLGDRINNLDKKINKVPDEKWDFSAAAGSYKGEHAVAIGAFYRPNEDTMFSVGGTIGNGNNMVNVGVSWKFGQKNRISANRISSAKEIIELRKNQEDVHSFLADAVAGNQLDLSKIQLFPDVEENHWAYDYVATMAGNGVLEGYPDGYFKGNRNMTRYEMAAVLYRLMQNGARLSDRALTEFAPELDRIRVDTITKHKDGTPHIQRVRTIKERVDEKADPSSKKETKKKAKIKVAEKPVE